MVKRLLIAIILLVLIVGGIVGFNAFRNRMVAEFFSSMTPPPAAVSVEEVAAVEWRPVIEAIGSARSGNGVELAVQAAGLVRDVQFKANDAVVAGQVLIQIDDRIERADLAAAIASEELARTELARNRALRERGINASNTLEVADAEEKSARAQVARLNAVLDEKRILAPFDGVIGIPRVEAGDYVTPGTIFATIQDLDRMQVDFTVPEQDVAQIVMGGAVTAVTEVGGLELPGTITGIEPRLDPGSRLVSVRADLQGADGRLLPGQFVRVQVSLPAEGGVIAVPQTAVSASLYGDSVFLVRPGEGEGALKAEQVFVKTGRRSGGRIEITEGVAAGDRVVTAGQNRLTSGAPVSIDNTVAPAAGMGG